MKTAVSLPEDLFRLAETVARRRQISRSELYATAIGEYLSREHPDAITEQLDEVYLRHSSVLDSPLQHAQLSVLDSESW